MVIRQVVFKLCEICEVNEKEHPEGKWCTPCKDDFKGEK